MTRRVARPLGRSRVRRGAAVALAVGAALLPAAARAQRTAGPPPRLPTSGDGAVILPTRGNPDSLAALGFEAEGEGRSAEAAGHYRRALAASTPTSEARTMAILGLERVWAELGKTDSLVPLVAAALRARPDDPTLRTVQLRALGMLQRDAEARAAYQEWRFAAAGDVTPYREYARFLLTRGRIAAADTVLAQAAGARGRLGARWKELALERAQLRAATGAWAESATAWREAMDALPSAEQGAVFTLQGAPDSLRSAAVAPLLAPPAALLPRRAAATLLLGWRRGADAWRALADLPADDSTLAAWRDAAGELERLEAWPAAREAWARIGDAARDPDAQRRAAAAALASGDAPDALARLDRLATSRPDGGVDPDLLRLRVRALAALGRSEDAERAVAAAGPSLDAEDRARVADAVARGWIAAGQLERARAALRTLGGPAADSGQAAGWLALFGGDLRAARGLLRRASGAGPEPAPGLAADDALVALALLGRTRAERAPAVGAAFLALARRDTAAAAAQLVDAAGALPDAAPLLLVTAARLHAARRDDAAAVALWRRVVESAPTAAEAPEAALAWARALRRGGDVAGARARLEQLIVTWPESALVPIARRELEAAP